MGFLKCFFFHNSFQISELLHQDGDLLRHSGFCGAFHCTYTQ